MHLDTFGVIARNRRFMKYLFLFFISLSAFADCKNLIDCSDAKKMVAGLPHGKQMLKCDEKSCGCMDGAGLTWWIEDSSLAMNKDGSCSFVVDQSKAKARADAVVAAKQKAIDDAAELAALKTKLKTGLKDGTASQADKDAALAKLLDKM